MEVWSVLCGWGVTMYRLSVLLKCFLFVGKYTVESDRKYEGGWGGGEACSKGHTVGWIQTHDYAGTLGLIYQTKYMQICTYTVAFSICT